MKNDNCIEITWEIDDGYVGKSRPQHTYIQKWELADCDDDAERERLIEEAVKEDFYNKISWCVTDDGGAFKVPKKEGEE
jgi:hypothetical protein